MTKVCKVDTKSPCSGDGKSTSVTFKRNATKKAKRIKSKAIRSLLNKAKRCYKTQKCHEPLSVTALTIGGCDICEQHVPEVADILETIAKTPIGKAVPVQLTEINYHKGGKLLFDKFKCEGTPCFILNGQQKLYEGRRGPVGVLSALFRKKNPLYK